MCWHVELVDRFSPKALFYPLEGCNGAIKDREEEMDGESERGVYQVRTLQMSPTFLSPSVSLLLSSASLFVSVQLFHNSAVKISTTY